jgi:hypothetical protein
MMSDMLNKEKNGDNGAPINNGLKGMNGIGMVPWG